MSRILARIFIISGFQWFKIQGKIPDNIINKPKLGLNPPMGLWLKKDLKKFIDDYLSKKSVEKRELFNYEYIRQIVFEHETNKRDRSLL